MGDDSFDIPVPVMGPPHRSRPASELKPARVLDESRDGSAEDRKIVAWTSHASRHGDDALHERLAQLDRIRDGCRRADVVDKACGRGRELPVGHLFAGDRVDQLLLSALRIRGRQRDDLDIAAGMAPELLDRLGLVVLDPDGHARCSHGVPDDPGTRYHSVAPLSHGPVIAGEVGLALAAVDDHGVHGHGSAEVRASRAPGTPRHPCRRFPRRERSRVRCRALPQESRSRSPVPHPARSARRRRTCRWGDEQGAMALTLPLTGEWIGALMSASTSANDLAALDDVAALDDGHAGRAQVLAHRERRAAPESAPAGTPRTGSPPCGSGDEPRL